MHQLCASAHMVGRLSEPPKKAAQRAAPPNAPVVRICPKEAFIGLLRRGVVLIGKSIAGLIECAALGVRCVNVGRQQAGRERPANVDGGDGESLEAALTIWLVGVL